MTEFKKMINLLQDNNNLLKVLIDIIIDINPDIDLEHYRRRLRY
jgi:hypothetical protein